MSVPRLGRLLIVDDEIELMTVLCETLSGRGYETAGFTSGKDALEALEEKGFDILLADLMMPGMDGIVLLRAALGIDPHLVGIIMTGQGTVQTAVEAMKVGAFDYVLKPFKLNTLLPVLDRAMEVRRLRQENLQLRETVAIYELSTTIAYTLDLNTLLNKTVEAARQQLDADEVSLMLPTPEGKELHVTAVRGEQRGKILGERMPMERGVAGWVARHHEPLILNGEVKDPRFAPLYPRTDIGSAISMPMLAGGTLVGVLNANVLRRRPPFTLGQVKSLNILISTAAAALEGAKLYAQVRKSEELLKQQLMRVNLLNRITRAVTERQDMDSIFRVVLGQLEDHLPIDTGMVLLFDTPADTLTVAVRGPKGETLAAELGISERTAIPVDQTMLRACIEGEMVYVPDTAQIGKPIPQRFAERGVRSVVAIPLAIEGKTFGILVVARREAGGFTSAECEFLQTLSEHVSLAAHQARLHQDLQKAYAELRQTQQAVMQQERLRALGQMASGIAHDINNALSPIVGFSDLLLVSEPNLSERAKKYLEDIQIAGLDITHIVARMREFYRQREEREALWSIQLNPLVQQVIDLTRPRWKDIPQELGIMVEIQTDLQEELPPVTGVESEIREALTNLIFNAVDAMPGGGKVTISTRVGLGVHGSKGKGAPSYVILEMRDTGMGMDEETRQRCLEPFFSTKGERGTGLGLAMVYGVMQRHEGEIDIESELGKGTAMRLIFPVRATVRPNNFLPNEPHQPSRPFRVLCMDDEPLLRKLLQEMLGSEGHRVEVADGGQAGLEAFFAARERGEPFEVVITDLGMPYLDGREVARTVKRESPTTPVILLTGWGTRMKAESDLPEQVDYVLSKPPKMKELREAIWWVTQTSH